MRKLRMMPVALSVVLSVAVLFGGWMVYKQVAVASPLSDAITNVPGVQHAEKPIIDRDEVAIKVELSGEAQLQDVYQSVMEQGKRIAGERNLNIEIQNEDDATLNAVWQEALFDVAQAMENKSYSDIPKTLDRLSSEHEGVVATTGMDDTNVYVTLKNENGAKYIVLPRIPAKMGVWPNA